MRVNPVYYRQQAERSRDLAEKTSDAEIKAHLISVAEQYDKLAKEAEAKPDRKGGSSLANVRNGSKAATTLMAGMGGKLTL